MFKKIKSGLKNHKKTIMMAVVMGTIFAIGSAAGATGTTPPDVATSVETEMGNIRDVALTILGSVATIAVVLFGGIYGWRYGKKVFAIISK